MASLLREALDAGHTVVTAHRRQARQIRFRNATRKRDKGISAWESPRVLAWDDWLVSVGQEIMWSGYSAPRTQRKLLSPFQELLLWERVLRAADDPLGDREGAARKARQAWGLVQAYRLPDPVTAAPVSADVAAFSRWMRAYFQRCTEQAIIDSARLPDSISPALKAGAIKPPADILLVGFDAFTPQQRLLLKTLENLGTRLAMFKSPRLSSEVQRVRLLDAESEYVEAARWAREILSNNESGHTAILIPELVAHSRMIERVFDDILMPGSSLPSSSFTGRPYNVAVGPPFDRYPIVSAALDVCALATGSVSFQAFSSFLRSSFTRAGGAEQALRARLERWLRDLNLSHMRLDQMPALVTRFKTQAPQGSDSSVVESVLAGIVPLLTRTRAEARASHWSGVFKEILDLCGWPGEVQLHSGEFQTVERFKLLIDEFAGLDFIAGPLSARGAVGLLRRMARDVQFQPQTPELSIQLLLPEQAYGLTFDNMWICGWHAEAWPRPPQPNPFLPIEWLRKHAVPRSAPEVELEFAKRLTSGLLSGARHIKVSTARLVDDREVAISPLLAVVPEATDGSLDLAEVTDYREAIRAATELESYVDENGPELDNIEHVRGGTRVLELQAKCPFRAFAELRLGATDMPEPAPGLDPMTRGMLVHLSLEHIWHRFSSHDVLVKLQNSEYLEVQVWEVVDRALTVADRKRTLPLPPRYREIEHRRLVKLVLSWLKMEVARPPFEVASTETERRVKIGGIEITTRVDRVDRLPDGNLVIIDYKTGSPRVAGWMDSRPDEPQLPVYAITEEGSVVAVLFARVRSNDHAFVGLASAPDLIPGIRAFERTPYAKAGLDWTGLFDAWRHDLDALAVEFGAGVATVTPKKDACRYCHLPSVCRIREHAVPQEAGDE